MPRTTRAAALRSAVHEDPIDAADIPLPATPTRGERAPLGEIDPNTVQEEPKVVLEVSLGKPCSPEKEKKKAARAAKKPKRGRAKKENNPAEVTEDDCQSSASSAAAEACRQLSRHGSECGELPIFLP